MWNSHNSAILYGHINICGFIADNEQWQLKSKYFINIPSQTDRF